jgi:hypothetical protein
MGSLLNTASALGSRRFSDVHGTVQEPEEATELGMALPLLLPLLLPFPLPLPAPSVGSVDQSGAGLCVCVLGGLGIKIARPVFIPDHLSVCLFFSDYVFCFFFFSLCCFGACLVAGRKGLLLDVLVFFVLTIITISTLYVTKTPDATETFQQKVNESLGVRTCSGIAIWMHGAVAIWIKL